jgi:phosphoglycolate phosphatase-like HAD superfamily hydrolase
MSTTSHFDADAYWRAGNCPWTFFVFPRALADAAGLPPDNEARQLLRELQGQGIPVGTWTTAPYTEDAYFACPPKAIGRLHAALAALEDAGAFESGFCTKRSEYLLALVAQDAEPGATPDPTRAAGSGST